MIQTRSFDFLEFIKRQMPESLQNELQHQSTNLPVRYFKALNPKSIREDLTMTERLPAERVIVTVTDMPGIVMLRVLVAADRPGIFLRVVSILARHKIGVQTASIFTGANDGMVLDHFVLQEPVDHAMLELARREIHVALMSGLFAQPEFVARPNREFFVTIDNLNRADHTTVTVTGADQDGFLFRIAQVFAANELSLKYARIKTHKGKVSNTFHVLSKTNQTLTLPEQAKVRAGLLRAFS